MHDVSAPLICATCELEILGSPTINQELPFCCAGCAGGGPCDCSYDPEPLGTAAPDSRTENTVEIAEPAGRRQTPTDRVG